MKVLKFGGTSVATPESISNVLSIVQEQEQCTVVVSALGGITDLLIDALEKAASKDKSYTSLF